MKITDNYMKGYRDGWHEAIAKMQTQIYKMLTGKGNLHYKQQDILKALFKQLEDSNADHHI